jgi:hypothetical protein
MPSNQRPTIKVHSIVAAVTQKIIDRSRDSRKKYLELITAEAGRLQQQPARHGIIRVDQGHHIFYICNLSQQDLRTSFSSPSNQMHFPLPSLRSPLGQSLFGCHTPAVCCVQWLPYSMLCPVDRSLIGQQPIFNKHGVCSMLMSNNRILKRG